MSASVIICGIRNAAGVIDYAAIKQMAGRAGRRRADLNPVAHIIAESDCAEDFKSHVDEVPSVASTFWKGVKFHVLSEISSGMVRDVSAAEKWYSRSLSFAQGVKVDFKKVFSELESEGVVNIVNGRAFVSDLGMIAIQFYFSTKSIALWKNHFEMIFRNGDAEDECAISWALAAGAFDIPMKPWMNDVMAQFPSEYGSPLGCVAECSIWHCVFSGASFPDCGRLKKNIESNFGRVCSALKAIDSSCGWNKSDYLDDLENMMRHGVSYAVAKYFKYQGMTKKLALHLFENGADCIDKIKSVMSDISDELTPSQKILLQSLEA